MTWTAYVVLRSPAQVIVMKPDEVEVPGAALNEHPEAGTIVLHTSVVGLLNDTDANEIAYPGVTPSCTEQHCELVTIGWYPFKVMV